MPPEHPLWRDAAAGRMTPSPPGDRATLAASPRFRRAAGTDRSGGQRIRRPGWRAAEEELRLLQCATMAIAEAEDLDEAFGVVLREVCERTGWDVGYAWMPQVDGSALSCGRRSYSADPSLDTFRAAGRVTLLRPGEGLAGRVWQTGAPAWLSDVTDPFAFQGAEAARGAGLRMGLAVPVLAGAEVVAVLAFFVRRPRAQDARLLQTVSAVAAQLGSAVRRKRAEEELRHHEQRLAEAQALAHLGSWEWDIGRNQLTWSDELYRICGLDPGDGPIQYDAYEQLIHPDDRAAARDVVQTAQRLGQPFDREYRIVRPDGAIRTLHGRGKVVVDEEGHPVRMMGVALDITERTQFEEQLRRTAEDLARSNADLEQFAYIASHDLQEPLRMVSSYTQLLAKRYCGRLDADADEFIGFAVEGALRMQALIQDLLTYSRVGRNPGPADAVQVDAVFERVLRNLAAPIQETGAVVTREGLPTVNGEAIEIGQLLQNLIANGIKFCREEVPRVHVSAERDGSAWQFCVRDNGIGIEAAHQERIFSMFQRLHTQVEYPGTGIGLAICRKVVERHGGRIWVESTPGEGSAFFFTLAAGNRGARLPTGRG